MGNQRCCVNNCRNGSLVTAAQLSYHRFPTKGDRREAWISFAAQGPEWIPNTVSFICSDHFKRDNYQNQNPLEQARLKPTAIPTVPVIVRTVRTSGSQPILLVGKGKRPSRSTDEQIQPPEKRMSTVDDLNKSFSVLSTTDLEPELEPDCQSSFTVQFTFAILKSGISLVELPSSWNTFSSEAFVIFFRVEQPFFEITHAVNIAPDLIPIIRIKNRLYVGNEFQQCSLRNFYELRELLLSLELAKLCPELEKNGADGCILIFKSAADMCTSCRSRKKVVAALASKPAAFRSRSLSLQRDRKSLKEKTKRLESMVRKQKLAIQELRAIGKQLKESAQFADLPEGLITDFVEITKKHKFHPKKYSSDFMDFAIKLRYHSPKAYDFLRDNGIPLPCPDTIRVQVARFSKECGFDPLIIHILDEWAILRPQDELNFSLVLDEMHVKRRNFKYLQSEDRVVGLVDYGKFNALLTEEQAQQPADHVLVLSVQGMKRKVFQPIGIFFSHSATPGNILKEIIEDAILKLDATHIVIRAIISDGGSGNLSAFRKFGMKFGEKHPTYVIINSRKRYVIIDIVHGTKNVKGVMCRWDQKGKYYRSRVMKWLDENGCTVVDENGSELRVDFGHVRHLFDIDQQELNKGCKLHPGLTKEMVFPNSFTAQRMRNTVKVISQTTVIALRIAEERHLMSGTKASQAFFSFFDGLFDKMNSSICDPKPSRSVIRFENDVQASLVRDRERLIHWKTTVPEDERLPNMTIDNLLTAVNSVLSISSELLAEGFDYVQTKPFNNDLQESFFSICRRMGGSSQNPTIETMLSIYRILAYHSMQKVCQKPGANVEAPTDIESIVGSLTVGDMAKSYVKRLEEARLLLFLSEEPQILPDILAARPVIPLDEVSQTVVYHLSGFSAYRLKLESKLCLACARCLLSLDVTEGVPRYAEFTTLKDHGGDRGGLQYVGPVLYNVFCELEIMFRCMVDQCLFEKPRETLVRQAESGNIFRVFMDARQCVGVECTASCICADLFREIADYYIRIRIHFYTKTLNEKMDRKASRSAETKAKKLAILTK